MIIKNLVIEFSYRSRPREHSNQLSLYAPLPRRSNYDMALRGVPVSI